MIYRFDDYASFALFELNPRGRESTRYVRGRKKEKIRKPLLFNAYIICTWRFTFTIAKLLSSLSFFTTSFISTPLLFPLSTMLLFITIYRKCQRLNDDEEITSYIISINGKKKIIIIIIIPCMTT